MNMLKSKLAKVREQAKSNKGFTLVELIVVIVILAILIGVSVNGYSKYIGQSRLNTDVQNAETLRSAFVNAQAEPGVYEELLKTDNAEKTLVMTVTGDGASWTTEGITGGVYKAAIEKALGDNWAKNKTQYTGGKFTITAKTPVTPDGNATVIVQATSDATYPTGTFANAG